MYKLRVGGQCVINTVLCVCFCEKRKRNKMQQTQLSLVLLLQEPVYIRLSHQKQTLQTALSSLCVCLTRDHLKSRSRSGGVQECVDSTVSTELLTNSETTPTGPVHTTEENQESHLVLEVMSQVDVLRGVWVVQQLSVTRIHQVDAELHYLLRRTLRKHVRKLRLLQRQQTTTERVSVKAASGLFPRAERAWCRSLYKHRSALSQRETTSVSQK